jgi:hypothetical protein
MRPLAVLRTDLELDNVKTEFISKCVESMHGTATYIIMTRRHTQGLQKAHASCITVGHLSFYSELRGLASAATNLYHFCRPSICKATYDVYFNKTVVVLLRNKSITAPRALI